MAASDHLQWQQLAMFAPAREIVETHELNDARADGVTNKQLMRSKQAENVLTGLDRDVAQHGVMRPIPVDHYPEVYGGKPIVGNGHHRLAAAYHLNHGQTFVPLEHYDMEHPPPTSALDDRGPGTWRHYRETH